MQRMGFQTFAGKGNDPYIFYDNDGMLPLYENECKEDDNKEEIRIFLGQIQLC